MRQSALVLQFIEALNQCVDHFNLENQLKAIRAWRNLGLPEQTALDFTMKDSLKTMIAKDPLHASENRPTPAMADLPYTWSSLFPKTSNLYKFSVVEESIAQFTVQAKHLTDIRVISHTATEYITACKLAISAIRIALNDESEHRQVLLQQAYPLFIAHDIVTDFIRVELLRVHHAMALNMNSATRTSIHQTETLAPATPALPVTEENSYKEEVTLRIPLLARVGIDYPIDRQTYLAAINLPSIQHLLSTMEDLLNRWKIESKIATPIEHPTFKLTTDRQFLEFNCVCDPILKPTLRKEISMAFTLTPNTPFHAINTSRAQIAIDEKNMRWV